MAHPAQPTSNPKPGWPSSVRRISWGGIDRLGVADNGELYWDGKPIVVRKGVNLTWWQGFLAFVVAVSTLASAAVAVLTYIRGLS